MTRPVFTSIAMKPPCTSGTCLSDQRLKLPSSLVTARTRTTSPTETRSPATLAFLPSLPSASRLRAQVTSSAGMTWPSSSSETPSMPIRAELSPTSRTTAGSQPGMSRGTSVVASVARHCASSASCSTGIALRVPRQTPCPRSYFSSASCSAEAAAICISGSSVARIVRPPPKNSSCPKLFESWRRISSVK